MLTSLVTYMEILTRPYAAGDTQLADKYRAFFTNSENLVLVPLSPAVAEEAARLRARHGLRTPDAIQLASARCYGADHVLTNDLSWKAIPGYSILTMEELGQEGA
jgi:predicted nucleic acid-binding protein